ncbi:hypothetical protein, partial [Pacificibacter sp.]|uniref:hypothetical protein n=1 Tax=Pacificibacter sp. TaxID=1917866 RepID=UPI00321B9457
MNLNGRGGNSAPFLMRPLWPVTCRIFQIVQRRRRCISLRLDGAFLVDAFLNQSGDARDVGP